MNPNEASIDIAAILTVDGLKNKEYQRSPSSLGYNDIAVMIAFAHSDATPNLEFHAPLIQEYLSYGEYVPEDARKMNAFDIDSYLDILSKECKLIVFDSHEEGFPKYTMPNYIARAISSEMPRLKSSHLDDLFFHGFRMHCLNASELKV